MAMTVPGEQATAPTQIEQDGPPTVHRFTVAEYEEMAAREILPPDGRTELIDGVIYDVSPQNPPHADTVELLTGAIYARLHGQVRIRTQAPLRLPPRSMPEPDLELLRADMPFGRHPTAEDVLLAIEVSHSTLRWDRERKVPLYAANRIPAVWIANVAERVVETHAELSDGAYRKQRTYGAGESVTVQGFDGVSIPVDEIFPPA